MDAQYWVVGATYGVEGDQAEYFVSGGYWMLGWKADENPLQAKLCEKIKPGDRIAIKKRQGRAATLMAIRFVGIVKGIIPCDYSLGRFICTVDWFNTEDLNRFVDFHGCGRSIHGPYTFGVNSKTDRWLESIFRI